MNIGIGSDDAGYALKEVLKTHFAARGIEVADYGCHSLDPLDYPDIALPLARDVAARKLDRGVLICGTGIGMAITANKVHGVYAAQAHDTFSAERARKSNNAQIITLGARVIGSELAKQIVDHWLDSEFAGGGSERKVKKIIDAEAGHAMKKLINDPFDVVEEVVEGYCDAHADLIRRVGRRAIARNDSPRQGKVGVVVGGGSGHLPIYMGYVGKGGADAAAIGNVFASPPAKPILEATQAANGGAGVVYVYGNYAGDVMNFDRAAALALQAGIHVETIRVNDDVASAPPAQREKRRGIAGAFFSVKIAAAKAETLADLDAVTAATRKANAATRSMGVALSSCTVPANGRPTFDLGAGEMEIGLGLHGEPGRRRSKLESADKVTDEIMETILSDMDYSGGEVALLINGLGGTPLEELYVIYRRVKQILDARKIRVRHKYIGEYATSLEMMGASVSLMRLDRELEELVATPANCPLFKQY
jgi:RpiB/LacA/LacB family sugar-phosphate isomerase